MRDWHPNETYYERKARRNAEMIRPLGYMFAAGLVILLAAFAWSTVKAQAVIIDGQGTATLSWVAPTEYEDGNPIAVTDLTGYVIYWSDQSRFTTGGTLRPGCSELPVGTRTDSSCYANVIDIADGQATSEAITFSLNQTTTLYFAAVAHVSSGEWSLYSNEAMQEFVLVVDFPQPGPPTQLDLEISVTCTTDQPNVSCTFIAT